MIDTLGEPLALAVIGLLGGIALGLAARIGRFCTLGAIEDALYADSRVRLQMWAFAIGVAVVTTFGAAAFGLLDLDIARYLRIGWNPAASIVGGLLFGYGMALAGNCGFGALARVGGGDFRAFVIVLVMGLSAYATVSGPLAHLRVWLFPVDTATSNPMGFAHLGAAATGVSPIHLGLLIGAAIVALSLLGQIRRTPSALLWATVVGLAITSGWIGTGWIAREGFSGNEVVSHTFAAPLGETMLYLMTASGNSLSFAIGSVAGVLLGAFLGSLIKGHFRWEACEDPRELRRQVLGAVLMGIGAVVAVGCTVGQGLSAASLLAVSAPVTMAAIFAGAAIGLRQLITGFLPAE